MNRAGSMNLLGALLLGVVLLLSGCGSTEPEKNQFGEYTKPRHDLVRSHYEICVLDEGPMEKGIRVRALERIQKILTEHSWYTHWLEHKRHGRKQAGKVIYVIYFAQKNHDQTDNVERSNLAWEKEHPSP